MINKMVLRKSGAALLLSLIGTSMSNAATVVAPTPTCNGRPVTLNITSFFQLAYGVWPGGSGQDNTYHVIGTTGDDVIMIDLPSRDRHGFVPNVFVYFIHSHPSLPDARHMEGGEDSVCVKRAAGAKVSVYGGRYIKTSGLGQTTASSLDNRGAYVEINGGSAFVLGGDGDDEIVIKAAEDDSDFYVEGGAGSDSIYVSANDDVGVDAGDGDDIVTIESLSSRARALVVGGKGADSIYTGDGSDLVYGSDVAYSGVEYAPGSPVNSFLDAYKGFRESSTNETRSFLTPLTSEDTAGGDITTNGGNDYIYGTDGTDYLRAGGGNDWVKGYGARDRIWGGDGNDSLAGGNGDDDVYGEKGDDKMDGNNGNDLMKGGKGNDIINGGADNDTIYGNEDDDSIDGGSGSDECHGDTGDNTLSYCEG